MTTDDAKTAAADARERLAETLDAIEDKVNIPRKLGEVSRKAQDSYAENPVPFWAAAGAVVVAIGGLIAAGVARSRR